ncbi:MAG TPA: hypothetical protein VMV52_01485 [Candidatus Nanopelagicaceae bacterium]|nr:hypothetical protein [Candidatus Nanopelagicaceae bacterium]
MNRNSKKSVLALVAAGALLVSGAVFGSSAFAADTTRTPAVSSSSSATVDSELGLGLNAPGVLDSVHGIISSVDDELGRVNMNVNAGVNASVFAQESDDEAVSLNDENQQEQESFSADISAAHQSGDAQSAAQLSTDASILASVTAPEVRAMVRDDSQAHAQIVEGLK